MSGSWWDKPAIIGHTYYSRKGEAQILGLLAVLAVAAALIAGPLWGLAIVAATAGTGAKNAARRRPRLTGRPGPRCTKACRTSPQPVDGDCGCVCRGVRHGRGRR